MVLRRLPTNVIPRGFGPDEDVHLDLNTRVAVHAPERHSMHFSGNRAAQRTAAMTAEAQAPSGSRLVTAQIVLAGNPGERTRRHFSVRGPSAAECLSAARAVTTATWTKR